MPRTLRVGMIGYRFMGKAHSNAWKQAPHFFNLPANGELHTIVGRDPGALEEARAQLGWKNSSTNWKAVVNSPDIDIVDINTPNDSHAEIAIAAAKAGKMLISEKPLPISYEELMAPGSIEDKHLKVRRGMTEVNKVWRTASSTHSSRLSRSGNMCEGPSRIKSISAELGYGGFTLKKCSRRAIARLLRAGIPLCLALSANGATAIVFDRSLAEPILVNHLILGWTLLIEAMLATVGAIKKLLKKLLRKGLIFVFRKGNSLIFVGPSKALKQLLSDQSTPPKRKGEPPPTKFPGVEPS